MLFGVNHCLPLLNMSKNFVYIHNIEERIIEFVIGYMFNPTLHVKKTLKEQVKKCTNYTHNYFFKIL